MFAASVTIRQSSPRSAMRSRTRRSRSSYSSRSNGIAAPTTLHRERVAVMPGSEEP